MLLAKASLTRKPVKEDITQSERPHGSKLVVIKWCACNKFALYKIMILLSKEALIETK